MMKGYNQVAFITATMSSASIISTILKHDTKVTSYKIALLRAINDVVLSFPDLRSYQKDVAIPLRGIKASLEQKTGLSVIT